MNESLTNNLILIESYRGKFRLNHRGWREQNKIIIDHKCTGSKLVPMEFELLTLWFFYGRFTSQLNQPG